MSKYNRYGLIPQSLWDGAGEIQHELFNLLDAFGVGSQVKELRASALPKITIDEDKTGFVVKAALPGYEPDKMEAEVIGDCLTIRGEKYTGSLDEGERYIHRERTADHLEETIKLPARVNPAKVHAEYKNGLLTVSLPREETRSPETIKVNVG